MAPESDGDVDLYAPTYGRFSETLHSPDVDERAIESAGLGRAVKEDTTKQVADVARRWHEARSKREAGLREAEGARPTSACNGS